MAVFDFLSWGHLLVIGLAALFIFGPERLPTLTRDAARGLKRARSAVEAIRAQVDDELGDDFAELRTLDLRQYHPRTFIRDQLFGGEGAGGPEGPAGVTPQAHGPSWDPPATGARTPGTRPPVRELPPPVDLDAT